MESSSRFPSTRWRSPFSGGKGEQPVPERHLSRVVSSRRTLAPTCVRHDVCTCECRADTPCLHGIREKRVLESPARRKRTPPPYTSRYLNRDISSGTEGRMYAKRDETTSKHTR
jgi:hypothetical protein